MGHKRTTRRANGANGKRRINGQGTVERRGDKWLARWTIRNPQGQPVRISKTFEADGIDAARAKLKELTDGNAIMTQKRLIEKQNTRLGGLSDELREIHDKAPALSVADAFDAFVEKTDAGKKPRETTREQYRYQYGRFVKWLAENYPDHTELRHITAKVAHDFHQHLASTSSANTHNKYLDLLRSMWDALERQDAIDETERGKGAPPKDGEHLPARLSGNPWRIIDRAEAPEDDTRRELTVEELHKVADAATGELRLLLAVGVYTGLRLGDACRLSWQSVRLDKGVIELVTSKTNGKVTIPVVYIDKATGKLRPSELWTLLASTPAEERQGFVMPELAALYNHDRAAVTDRIQRLFRSCGISTTEKREDGGKAKVAVGFHSLRHSFVTFAARSNISLEVVKQIVGHRNQRMTTHYLHARADWLQREMSAFPSLGVIGEDTANAPQPKALPSTTNETGDGSRLATFRSAWYALTAEERREAQKWLAEEEAK